MATGQFTFPDFEWRLPAPLNPIESKWHPAPLTVGMNLASGICGKILTLLAETETFLLEAFLEPGDKGGIDEIGSTFYENKECIGHLFSDSRIDKIKLR